MGRLHVLLALLTLLPTGRAIDPADMLKMQQNLELEITKGPDEKFYNAKIGDDDYLGMYQKWFDTGMSSLFSAVANKKLKRQRRSVQRKFGLCSSEATTLTKHAKCLTRLLKGEIREEGDSKRAEPRLDRYRAKTTEAGWTGGFRTGGQGRRVEPARRLRRAPRVQQADAYGLRDNRDTPTPLGAVARLLVEEVKTRHNLTQLPSWHRTVARLRANGARRRQLRQRVADESEESLGQLTLRGLRERMQPAGGLDPDQLHDLVQDPAKLRALVAERRRSGQSRPEERVVDTIREAMRLAYALAGHNTTNFDNRTMKLVSPRFLGVTKEEAQDDEINLMSPSLFSLHNDGEGLENLTSLPNLLRGAGLHDHELWLDLIMEAAGVNAESDRIEGELRDYEFGRTKSLMTNVSAMVDEKGAPLYATKANVTELGGDTRRVDLFEKLHSSYTKDQLRELNSTGYAFLNRDQVDLVYGPDSPTNDSDAHRRFRLLSQLADADRHAHMHEHIERVAELERFEIRQKDVVLSPVSFLSVVLNPKIASQGFILSPIIFTSIILSPSIFGAVILSPWMFVPLVLAPRVLGALVLSPFLFAPIILTPLALHPAVLSPGVFNPLVLSPLLMVPFILSPQVFTPLILSPLCLSPIILNPMVGSPLILSPFVLSPIVASPMALSALVMSPYALSPVLFSPLIAFAAVLSPSWLS